MTSIDPPELAFPVARPDEQPSTTSVLVALGRSCGSALGEACRAAAVMCLLVPPQDPRR